MALWTCQDPDVIKGGPESLLGGKPPSSTQIWLRRGKPTDMAVPGLPSGAERSPVAVDVDSCTTSLVAEQTQSTKKKTMFAQSVEASKPAGRLLVVDDHEANLILMSRMLQKKNFSLEMARDGRQACDRAAEQVRRIA